MTTKGVLAKLENYRALGHFSLAITIFTYLVMVVGSLTRSHGAGLACPDWPKCFGKWLPPLDPLVFLEWFHRFLVFLMSNAFLVLVLWVLVVPAFRRQWGKLMGLSVVLLIVQIVLGGLTVLKLLAPWTVFTHLGNSLLFLTTLLVLTMGARRQARGDQVAPVPALGGLVPLTLVTTAAVYGQILLGVVVSSNYAGLACPDWPLCNGMLFPPMSGGVALQVIHRLGAYTVAGLVLALVIASRQVADRRIRIGAGLSMALVLVQITLGVLNVFYLLPPVLSGAHLAVAVLIWVVMVVLSYVALGQRQGESGISATMATVR